MPQTERPSPGDLDVFAQLQEHIKPDPTAQGNVLEELRRKYPENLSGNRVMSGFVEPDRVVDIGANSFQNPDKLNVKK